MAVQFQFFYGSWVFNKKHFPTVLTFENGQSVEVVEQEYWNWESKDFHSFLKQLPANKANTVLKYETLTLLHKEERPVVRFLDKKGKYHFSGELSALEEVYIHISDEIEAVKYKFLFSGMKESADTLLKQIEQISAGSKKTNFATETVFKEK